MTFDELREEMKRWLESDVTLARRFVSQLERQPGFLLHRDEVLAEYARMPPIDGTLTQLTQLLDAYKTVMRRHGLPEALIDEHSLPQ